MSLSFAKVSCTPFYFVRCVVFSKVMRRTTIIATLHGRGRGLRVAVHYSFAGRLEVSRDITRGNIYLAIISVGNSRCAIATVGRALSESGLNGLRINDLIGLRHSVLVGNHLSNRVIRNRISRVTAYARIHRTSNDRCCRFRCRAAPRVHHHNCLAISGNSMAIGNISLAMYAPAGGDFRITVVPCAERGAGFYRVGRNAIMGVRFSVVKGCVTHVGDTSWGCVTIVSSGRVRCLRGFRRRIATTLFHVTISYDYTDRRLCRPSSLRRI